MKLSLYYDKKYIKKYFWRVIFPFGVLIIYSLISRIDEFFIGKSFNPTITNCLILFSWSLIVVASIFTLYSMFKKPYIIIDNAKCIFDVTRIYGPKVIPFKDIKESYIVEKIYGKVLFKFLFDNSIHNPESLVIHMKNGGKEFIALPCLSDDDVLKLVEVFRERGRLKEPE